MADLFGGSNLLSHPPFLPQAQGLTLLASALLQGAGASWQSGMANALPKSRGESPQGGGAADVARQDEMMNGPSAPTFGPDVSVGTNTSTQPAWMGGESSTWNVSPVALAAAPYTGGVSMATASPVIQDAPAFGYIEPSKRNWDGTTVNGPAWMQSAPQKSYVANSAEQLADMAFAAQDSTELQKLAAANADWMKYGGVQKLFKQADQLIGNAEIERQRIANRSHQSNMEKLTERGRNAQLAGLNGIGKINEGIIADFDYIAQHGTPEHVALATEFLDREKFPQAQVAEGINSANPQSIVGLSRLKQSIIDAKQKEAGLVTTQINPKGEVTMGRPRVGDADDAHDFKPQEFYDKQGNVLGRAFVDSKTGETRQMEWVRDKPPADVLAAQANNKAAIATARKELEANIREAAGLTNEKAKKAAGDLVRASEAKVKTLEDKQVVLSTNWMNKASTPTSSTVEVERQTADGKIGIYDANTKAFLRWK